MRPLRLYIKDFMCHDKSYIDFTQFNCALIVGKVENNDMKANGVGKSTIFKALEYVLFNQSEITLDRIIRDDTNGCQVVIDFSIDDQEYRLARSRTRKGSTDLTLLQRNAEEGPIEEVYHDLTEYPFLDKKDTSKYWKDLSGSRASDTEKDIAKLIKINHKSFCSTIMFPQNDMNGLPTATPEKRKAILKEAFNLIIYSKLEKIAKDRASSLNKEIDKQRIIYDSLGNPTQDLLSLDQQFLSSQGDLKQKMLLLEEERLKGEKINQKILDLTQHHSNLESKCDSLLSHHKSALSDKSRAETSTKEYFSKKTNIAKAAKDMIGELNLLKEEQSKLAELDYSQIDIVSEVISTLKEEIGSHNLIIKTAMEKYEELKIPLPSGSICKNCRKPMTDKDREEHKKHIVEEMASQQEKMQTAKAAITVLNQTIASHQQTINSLKNSKQNLETVNTKITLKNKEMQEKRNSFEEYQALWKKYSEELQNKTSELERVEEEMKSSSVVELNALQLQIDQEKELLTSISPKTHQLNKEISHLQSALAVITHSIEQKKVDEGKKTILSKNIKEIEEKLNIYPSVLQAVSSTGIPNLIIQNVLDDLQIESNTLLNKLNPSLQLSFFVEKTVEKTGEQADTLDISYLKNGRERYYKQLSGAEQLAVNFSLKLGLSFVLQKMFGSDIKMLLLDELDQSLDKATVDEYADLVKFFQKDFTVLIITHNDRLKDKFSHAILVEQDLNMISHARVVSSW